MRCLTIDFQRLVALAVFLAIAACGGHDNNAPEITVPNVGASPMSATTAPVVATRPCPVQADICAWAVRMHAVVVAKDVNSLVAASEPRTFVCRADNRSGIGGRHPPNQTIGGGQSNASDQIIPQMHGDLHG